MYSLRGKAWGTPWWALMAPAVGVPLMIAILAISAPERSGVDPQDVLQADHPGILEDASAFVAACPGEPVGT